MRWRKLGQVYCASGHSAWAHSHAFCPTTVRLGDLIRVFCAFVDLSGVGRAGYVDVDALDPTSVVGISDRPVLDVGSPGAFDDSGVTPLSVLGGPDGELRMYYAGWQLGIRVRYFLFAGLAESSDDGLRWRRVARVPVLERSDGELTIRTGSRVLFDQGRWRMWYGGGSRWFEHPDGTSRPSYSLRYAESQDGVRWPTEGRVVMPETDEIYGFGRPAIQRDGDLLRMWYSVRYVTKGYRIECAESQDGIEWEPRQDARLPVSDSGWDSEMVGLACVQTSPTGTYLFYNGNGYGKTGFGVAILED